MNTPFVDALNEATEIIKITGLVGGALWTAWTFHKLQKVRSEEVGIQKKVAEIQQMEWTTRNRCGGSGPRNRRTCRSTSRLRTRRLRNPSRRFLYTLTVARVVFAEYGEQTVSVLHRAGPIVFRNTDVPEAVTNRVLQVGQSASAARVRRSYI